MRRDRSAALPYDADAALRGMLGVRASMERDGWGPAMRVRDAMPPDWHPTAEQLRLVWWVRYGVPDWFEDTTEAS